MILIIENDNNHHENMPIQFDPLRPHFDIDNWVLQGYTLFFLYLLKNIDCGYSLEPPLTNIHDLCFEQRNEKYQNFLFENFHFFFFFFWW